MAYIDFLLIEHIFPLIGIWFLVYVGDYYLTIVGAQLYTAGAKKYIRYEGSYELTPVFQKDIDNLRLISPRFVGYVILSCVVIYGLWILDVVMLNGYWIYLLVVGGLFLREAAIYLRHFRSISLFRILKDGHGVEGKLHYRRWLILRISGTDLFAFAIFFLILYSLYQSWFLLGGVISCLVTGLQHIRWSRKKQQSLKLIEEN